MKKIFVAVTLFLGLSTYAQTSKGAYALFNYDSSSYMVSHNISEVRSIASITKLFTAITIIKSGVDLDEKIKVAGRSSGHVPAGIYVSRFDLLRATIISSDNRAAETLANNHPGGFDQFLKDVNRYLDENNLYNTRIVDSTGLLSGNVSTAKDLVEFIHQIQNEPVIRKIANEKNAVINLPKGKKTININLRNTNPDLFHYDNILISKTGFTNAAGRCVLMLVEREKILYAVVVLGQNTPKTRSQVVGNLLSVEFPKEPTVKIDSRVEFEYSNPL